MTDQDRVNQALDSSLAANTRRAYLSQWKAFAAWAQQHEHVPLPAEPGIVAAHLANLAATASASTLRVRRAAIAAAHRSANLPDPTATELVKRTVGGLVRQIGTDRNQSAPLTAKALAAIRASACLPRSGGGPVRSRCESSLKASRRGLVDIALCSVMRDALLRRSEAASLTWADITPQNDGSGLLRLRLSKTDQHAASSLLYLGPQCMRDLAAIRPPEADPDARVFPLSASQISRRIAEAARAAGLGDGFSGRSPRIGMAQDLSAAGASLSELMHAGRWTSSSMPALYTRSQAASRDAVAEYYATSRQNHD